MKIDLNLHPLGVKHFARIRRGLERGAGSRCSQSVDVFLKCFQEMFQALLEVPGLDLIRVYEVPPSVARSSLPRVKPVLLM